MQRVDLAALAAESVEAARLRAQEEGVDLRLSAGDGLPPVRGDRSRLGQVIDNLVSNAVKFTPHGGSAEVRLGAPDGHVEIVVSDTGIGIPPEERERLFQRFFRARTATEAGIAGTGLGLAVSRAIVEGHGGSISLDPGDGPGTTFRVRLPRTPAGEGDDPR
jgi:signal transduction histidine kinase